MQNNISSIIRLFQLNIINHRGTEKKDEDGRMMGEKEEITPFSINNSALDRRINTKTLRLKEH
jgi:hypothetical protein